jgi:hypothetical protein
MSFKWVRYIYSLHWVLSALLIGQFLAPARLQGQISTGARTSAAAITIGQSVVALHGPWKFRTGDNPRWADPDFDDAAWETVDLTPPAGSHDADVGLTGYVPGWAARGHSGESGYAWYRMRVSMTSAHDVHLALAGPPDVDDAYQVYFNGHLLGGIGDFSGAFPRAYAIRPLVFSLPQNVPSQISSGLSVLALRVWMSPDSLASPDVGGIHIAPTLGEAAEIENRIRAQWLELIRGYFLEIVQASLFAALAVMACSLLILEPSNRGYAWLALALVLTGAARANLAFVSWTQWESAKAFVLIENVLLIPLMLGAWTIAWYHLLQLRSSRWIRSAAARLTMVYVSAQLFGSSAVSSLSPHLVQYSFHFVSSCTRLAFLALVFLIAYRGLMQARSETWFALPAIALISVGLFAPELSYLHIPGIWFPYGTGVSRTQFAYAASNIAVLLLLLRRIWLYAQTRSLQTLPKPARFRV